MSNVTSRIFDSELSKEKKYWLRNLSVEPPVSGLPLDFRRPASSAGKRARAQFEIDQEVADRLLKVSGEKELLVFVVFLTALKIYLHKHNATEDVIVGTAILDQEEGVSSTNNAPALRDRISGELSAKEILQSMKRTLSAAYANQKFPFERIVELLKIES